ncbi:MAG: cardiolipin synthase [Rikenellaceae bacterium]
MIDWISIEMVLYVILSVTYAFFIAFVLIGIIITKGDPVKSLTWIIVILIFPIIGILCYLTFGRNLRKKKILKKGSLRIDKYFAKIVVKQKFDITVPSTKETRSILENKKMVNLLFNNNIAPLTHDNSAIVLNNGEETFAKIKEQLLLAKVFIHLEYYIIEDDIIGNEIADILIKKANEGVEVRIIFDAVGSWSLTKHFIRRLTEAGIEVKPFLPVVFPLLTSHINYRNHRKIIIIDGDVSFTGGINIADRYVVGTKKLGSWRDTHLMLEGSSTLALHAIFANDWFFVSGQMLDNPKYTPSSVSTQHCAVQIASSGPDTEWASIMNAFFSAITKAKHHLYISTPYFVPGSPILTAVKIAAMSGVDVRIMLPKKSDSKMTYYATRSYITELLESGVKVYFYKPGFNHSKIMMTDSSFATIGTANMDVRSFEQNYEVAAMIYNNEVATDMECRFLQDLKEADRIYINEWNKRSKLESWYEGITRLFSPLL